MLQTLCLTIKKRIDFEILTVVHKCLLGVVPKYLKDLHIIYQGGQEGLGGAKDSKKLIMLRTYHKTLADRSFSVYGPLIWNALPSEI